MCFVHRLHVGLMLIVLQANQPGGIPGKFIVECSQVPQAPGGGTPIYKL